jgi:Tfp pilus assembly protein PilF
MAAAFAGIGAAAAQTEPPSISFTRDVQPIVRARCAPCHRPGGAAPFALDSYDDVTPRGAAIARAVDAGHMPPWLPEQGSETFVGARRLTADERNAILRWIGQGMVRDESSIANRVTPVESPDSDGKPDLILDVDVPFAMPAEGPDVFRNFVLRVPLERPRYVRALRIEPGESRAVHHASLGVDRSRMARRLDDMTADPGFPGMLSGGAASPPGHFIGWAPGRQTYRSPAGLSWRLDAGSDLVLQVHMMPTGAAEVVRPRVALFFTDEPPTARAVLVRLGSTDIDIAAGAQRHAVEDTFELPVGVRVLSILPHAHYLAREIESVALLPDGHRVPLVTIRSWNFRWQDDYRYVVPLTLPASTRITTRVVYDNSSSNPAHPLASPQRVVYGPGAHNEMGDVWLQVVPDSAAEAARLERALAVREIAAQSNGYRLASATAQDPLPRFTLATLYMQAGRLTEAVSELDRVIAQAPFLTIATYTRGVALQRAGRLTEAARDFRDALKSDPRYAEAEHALGHVRLAEGNRPEAERHFTTAVTLWPEFADGWNSLATLRATGDQIDDAVDAYRRALAVSPDHREALNNLGILLARRGQVTEAIALLERAVAAHPDDEASRQNLAAARARERPK